MPRPTFGVDVACRECGGTGRARGSGLDPQELERRRRIRAKDPDDPAGDVPTMHKCGRCLGTGITDVILADRQR